MKLILDTENSHPTTITVRGKEIILLLILIVIKIIINIFTEAATLFPEKYNRAGIKEITIIRSLLSPAAHICVA